jgi:transposase
LAAELNLELMFMPPYTPEFNCIEALWSVIKRDFKKRVLAMQQVHIGDALFKQLLQESLDAIKPEVQKKAARSNNRGFMYLVLGKLVAKQEELAAMQAPISDDR